MFLSVRLAPHITALPDAKRNETRRSNPYYYHDCMNRLRNDRSEGISIGIERRIMAYRERAL